MQPKWTPSFFLLALAAGCAGNDAVDVQTPVYSASLRLTIGSIEGDGPDLFGRISGIAVDGDGRIFVADAQAHEVRVFDREGTHQFTFGRQGGGPGELDGPCCLAFDSNGDLWIRDTGNGRYNRYRVGAGAVKFVNQIRMQHGAAGFWNATTFDSNGNLIDVGMAQGTTGPEVVRFRIDSSGAVVSSIQIPQPSRDSVGEAMIPFELSGGRRGLRYFQQPFGPQHRVAHSSLGEWAKVLTSVYSVYWFGPDDEPLRIVTREVPEVPVSPAERDSVKKRLLDELQPVGKRLSDLPWGVPGTKVPIRGIYFDDVGRLWVELSVAEGAPRRADVFERTGGFAYSVEWPEDTVLFPAWIGQHEMVAVQRDDLGVQRVVRLAYGPDSIAANEETSGG